MTKIFFVTFPSGWISIATRPTHLTKLAHGIMLTFFTHSNSFRASTVPITPTTCITLSSCPTYITPTFVVWGTWTYTVHTVIITPGKKKKKNSLSNQFRNWKKNTCWIIWEDVLKLFNKHDELQKIMHIQFKIGTNIYYA